MKSLDARRHGSVLVDVVDVADIGLREVVQQLSASMPGRRLVVLHAPSAALEGLDDLDLDLVPDPADRAELAVRFGAARSVRVFPVGETHLIAATISPTVERIEEPDADAPDLVPAGPVFVGGTGRSGTWVLGRMFGSHPNWVTVHTELRFHAAPPGFASVLLGKKSPAEYAEIVQRKWFRASGASGKAKGLQLIAAGHELRRALQVFVKAAEDDVPAALGRLMLDVTAPYVRGRGALGFTETTPDNAGSADSLTAALPTARVIHVVRDGRDVASSVASMSWGPDDPWSGLDWWATRIRRANRAMTDADPDRVWTVRLEELVALERDSEFERLVDFAGFGDKDVLRRYFDAHMNPQEGNVGRWRSKMSSGEQERFERRYREVLDELSRDGVACLPADPARVDELARS